MFGFLPSDVILIWKQKLNPTLSDLTWSAHQGVRICLHLILKALLKGSVAFEKNFAVALMKIQVFRLI
jgi:hypothetical protein